MIKKKHWNAVSEASEHIYKDTNMADIQPQVIIYS